VLKTAEKLPARNYILIVELRSTRPSEPFERAIKALGSFLRLNHTTWLLRAETTLGAVRNELAMFVGTGDSFLIVDVGEGRKLSHQFGPEVEAKLRAIWPKVDLAVGSAP
jgi:hypothetical protein